MCFCWWRQTMNLWENGGAEREVDWTIFHLKFSSLALTISKFKRLISKYLIPQQKYCYVKFYKFNHAVNCHCFRNFSCKPTDRMSCIKSTFVLHLWSVRQHNESLFLLKWMTFYRTQVSLGSDLWVLMSVTPYKRFCRLNWCDSGWWGYQLNTSWWCQ